MMEVVMWWAWCSVCEDGKLVGVDGLIVWFVGMK